MYTIMQCSVLELYDLSMKYCIKSKYFILDILNVYSINYVFVLFLWFHLKFNTSMILLCPCIENVYFLK